MKTIIRLFILLFFITVTAQKSISPIPIPGTDLVISAVASSPNNMTFSIYNPLKDEIKGSVEVFPYLEHRLKKNVLDELLAKKDSKDLKIASLALELWVHQGKKENQESKLENFTKPKELAIFILNNFDDATKGRVSDLLKTPEDTNAIELLKLETLIDVKIDQLIINKTIKATLLKIINNTKGDNQSKVLKKIKESQFKYYESIEKGFMKELMNYNRSKISNGSIKDDSYRYFTTIFRTIYFHFNSMANVLFEYDNEPIAGTIKYDTLVNITVSSPETLKKKILRKTLKNIRANYRSREKGSEKYTNYNKTLKTSYQYYENMHKYLLELKKKKLREDEFEEDESYALYKFGSIESKDTLNSKVLNLEFMEFSLFLDEVKNGYKLLKKNGSRDMEEIETKLEQYQGYSNSILELESLLMLTQLEKTKGILNNSTNVKKLFNDLLFYNFEDYEIKKIIDTLDVNVLNDIKDENKKRKKNVNESLKKERLHDSLPNNISRLDTLIKWQKSPKIFLKSVLHNKLSRKYREYTRTEKLKEIDKDLTRKQTKYPPNMKVSIDTFYIHIPREIIEINKKIKDFKDSLNNNIEQSNLNNLNKITEIENKFIFDDYDLNKNDGVNWIINYIKSKEVKPPFDTVLGAEETSKVEKTQGNDNSMKSDNNKRKLINYLHTIIDINQKYRTIRGDLIQLENRKKSLISKSKSLKESIELSLTKMQYFKFSIREIQLDIKNGFIENIKVPGKILGLSYPSRYSSTAIEQIENFIVQEKFKQSKLSGELKFENQHPIGFSAETDFQDLSDYKLYHIDEDNKRYELKLNKVITNYFQELQNDRLDFSPKNQSIKLREADPEKKLSVTLKKESSSKLLTLKIFTDFIGFGNEEPNGILQLEVDKEIPLNTKRIPLRLFRDKLDRDLNIGFFNSLNFSLNWRRLESNETKDLELTYVDRFLNNEYSPIKYATHLDILRNENLSVGLDINTFSFDMPSLKMRLEFNGKARFGRTKVIDSIRTFADGKVSITKELKPSQLNTWRITPEVLMRIRPEERFGAVVSWKPTYFNTTTSDFNDISSAKRFLKTGKDDFNWLLRLELFTYFTPSTESDNRFFFRYRYNNTMNWEYNGFHEVQVGYSAFLKF